MDKPKRWLVCGFIGLYLGSLSYGILAHTLQTGTGSHPAMYFVVWDMFCGWSAWSTRNQIVAEGESGKFYDVGTPPWRDYCPYGSLARRHYDPNQRYVVHLAQNVLKHTMHEPITRIFVVEEAWPKRFNLPDPLWQKRLSTPKDRKVYTHLRHVVTGEGMLLSSQPGFITYQTGLVMAKNPRLRHDSQKRRPFITLESKHSGTGDPAMISYGTINAN